MTAKPHNGRRAYPPAATGATSNVILSARCAAHQDVLWIYTHTADGSYVSGYELREKNDDEFPCGATDRETVVRLFG